MQERKFKLPSIEEMEASARETERRIREVSNPGAEFCPVSLGDWLELCRRAGVPHVPAVKVAEIKREDYLRFDTDGEHQQRLQADRETIKAAVKNGCMMRLDCCSDAEVKHQMAQGNTGFRPEFGAIMFGDMRSFDLVYEYPRDNIPIWQRPWVEVQAVDGYPVEYRAYVRDGKLQGISSYYPQRPLPEFPQHLETVREMTEKLIGNAEPPFLWHNTPMLLDAPLDLEGLHFTADFLVTQGGEVLFLEGGPPHELGAHMCCFRPGEIQGVALEDRNGPG